MKHSDRPVTRPSDDLLGRSKFSLALARSIDGLLLAKDGFVIAVIGDWGAGKSSVIEMTLRHLTHIEMERVAARASEYPQTLDELEKLADVYDIIRDRVDAYDVSGFNFSNTRFDYRIDQFEKWLASKEKAKEADTYWRLLQTIEGQRRTIQVRFSPWLIAGRSELATALLSELARALGEKLGPGIQKAFASLLGRLGELAPIAGAGIDLATGSGAGKIVSAGITWSSKAATAQTTGPTLEQLRERLRSLLRALNDKRILVIIDDLDRLTPNEAKEMVGLVKSLGDLPNVIYLLSYDEKNLTELISHTTPLDGHSYLKKIVQYPIHLPPISRGGLAKIFDADLSEILPPLDEEQNERIGYTWQYIFRHYLTTPRDVRLYINSLAVSLSSQRDYVDPIDLILLELLRLYEPDLYFWIINHIEELTE